MVNVELGNEMWIWDKETLSLRQESNLWPPKHMAGALSTELRELVESKVI